MNKPRTATRMRPLLKEALVMLLMIAGILAARSSLADHYVVPSGSMEYTLLPGDRVVVDKRAYGLRLPFTRVTLLPGEDITRGDVVIFDSPADGTRLIKRIVAVGGDRVDLVDGRLAIDGKWLTDAGSVERFDRIAASLRLDHGGGPDFSGTIPEGALLAIGDHRGNSRDSRYFGLIAREDVYARAVAVYYRREQGLVWLGL